MRLAYQDMEADRKKQEAKMKNMDPKKREQMERLGMGLAGPRGASHSMMTDMTVIEQQTPTNDRGESRFSRSRKNDFDDDFEIVNSSLSGPPKYTDSPFGLKKEDRYSSWNDDNKKSSWDDNKKSSSAWDMDRFDS